MTPRRVHQLVAALSYGDAIGNEALAIQGHLRRAGFDSDIFAERVHPRMAHLARPLWEYGQVSSPETVCLFHFSIGSAAGRLIYHAPDRLVSIYHNITPADSRSRRLNSLSASPSSVREAKAASSRRP